MITHYIVQYIIFYSLRLCRNNNKNKKQQQQQQ